MTIRKSATDGGFSFIELLAYMAIAALLILAAVPQFNSYRTKATISNMQSDLKNAAQAVEAEYSTRMAYPNVTTMTFATSAGITIAGVGDDPNAPLFSRLQLNTGAYVDDVFIENQDRSGVLVYKAAFYTGAEGSQALLAHFATCASSAEVGYVKDSYVMTALNEGRLAWVSPREGGSCTAGALSSARDNKGTFSDLDGNKRANTRPYDVSAGGWSQAWEKSRATPDASEAFCLTASADRTPQQWHWASGTGMARGAC